MRQKNWITVYPLGSRTNIKCEICRPGLAKPSHISYRVAIKPATRQVTRNEIT
jgi:hypothetical protein